jgi:hypothetical protein
LVVTFDYNRRLISPEPKANRVELDRCEEAGGELVVAGGDDGSASAWRRPLDQVALAVEVHDEARLPLRLLFGGMLGVAL